MQVALAHNSVEVVPSEAVRSLQRIYRNQQHELTIISERGEGGEEGGRWRRAPVVHA